MAPRLPRKIAAMIVPPVSFTDGFRTGQGCFKSTKNFFVARAAKSQASLCIIVSIDARATRNDATSCEGIEVEEEGR
jgi:hypothetical protein